MSYDDIVRLLMYMLHQLAWVSDEDEVETVKSHLMLSHNHSITCYDQSLCDKAVDDFLEPITNYPFHECCQNESNSIFIVEKQYCVTFCFPTKCFKYSYTCEDGTEEILQQENDTFNECCESGSSVLLLNSDDKYSICIQCPEQKFQTSGVGLDPHFSVLLPTGHQLCFTVQGEQGFVFNLVHSPQLTVNALFIPDELRDEITWIGSLAIIIEHPNTKDNKTTLRFEAKSKIVHINEQNLLMVGDNGLHITLFNGTIDSRSNSPSSSSYVLIDIKDIGLSFSVEYVNQHLDIVYYKIPNSGFNCSYRGLLGQFFCPGYSIDEVRKLLLFPSANREPVPVMRRPIWSFMEREKRNCPDREQQMCWMAMNAGYQGEGLLEADHLKYIIPDLFSSVKKIYRKD